MKILIVDDNKDNLDMVADVVQMLGHEPVKVQSGYEALDQIADTGLQFAIVDWMMPEMDGIELVNRIRAQFSERYTYIIMLTALGTVENVAHGLESGADDYITKPFLAREMLARIKTGQRIIDMESRLASSLQKMENLATRDHLTKLYNRRQFLEIAAESLETTTKAALFMMDIDHFKQVNDRFGHPIGDQVLQQVASTCEEMLHGKGIIARYGGEEFIGFLPEYSLAQAIDFTDELREKISSTPNRIAVEKLTVTVSIGVASCTDKRNLLEDYIQAADNALYQAKKSGRNQVKSAGA